MEDTGSVDTRVTVPNLSRRTEDSSITLLTANVLEVKKELSEVKKDIGDMKKAMKRLDEDVDNVFVFLQALEAKFKACGLLK
jgi:peptidoglycan hydrolase CwlO-like protein